MAAVASWVLAILVIGVALVAGYFVFATRKIAARAERLVPPSGKFVDIDGNRIHYAEAGTGRAIVFIHGLGAQFHQFEHPLFASLQDDFHLVALDRPGSGYSTRAAGASAGLSEQARIVVRLIEHAWAGAAASGRSLAGRHGGAGRRHRASIGDLRAGAARALYALPGRRRAGLRAAVDRQPMEALADFADGRHPRRVEDRAASP